MKKKMIIAAVFVAAIAITASVAFACTPQVSTCGCDQRHRHSDDCCPKVEVNAETDTTIINEVDADADSGDNYISSESKDTHRKSRCYSSNFVNSSSRAVIETGKATAINTVETDVEGAVVEVTAPRRGTVEIDADTDTFVKNEVDADADSGDNTIRTSSGRARITTDEAYADNQVTTKVLGSDVVVK